MTKSSSTTPRPWKRGGWWGLVAVYALLLITSHLIRAINRADHNVSPGLAAVTAHAVKANRRTAQLVRIAHREHSPDHSQDYPTLILLHGSPGNKGDFDSLFPQLAETYRVIVPDHPGFGDSTREIPDYSVRAHAEYVLQMMEKLNVRRAHVVGFSMGGGVALNLADLAPDRVASVTLLSAIGVQEMELLGDYHLNHALHGLQLAGLWLLREATPHMGWFDDAMFGVPYARNFYDSDQRPLREILMRYAGPMLIIHGRRDVLVPVAAALEHHRLVAQSELQLFDDDHFMTLTRGPMLAEPVGAFVARVELGQTPTRTDADPERLRLASQPFNPASIPKAMGVAAFVLVLLIAIATLVSEDLTCICAGVMAAQGRIDFSLVLFACFLGIFVGDMLLFLTGRYLGRPAVGRAPLRWFIRAEDVEMSSAWFSRKGGVVILVSRFVPGMRLPTYFASGLLRTSFWRFALYFSLAAAVWTPLLVGLSRALGAEVLKSSLLINQSFFIKALAACIILYLLVKLTTKLPTYRGRRLLVSSWRRMTRWEFWPPWMFYPPVICYIAYLMLKHRSLTIFTAANPAMIGGGFVGESKMEILRGLSRASGFVARAAPIEASRDLVARIRVAESFMAEYRMGFPVVLKPDRGQRGSGVVVVRSQVELNDYLCRTGVDTLIQEYVPGSEFGVFYYRLPGEDRGRIFSITEKRFPVVVGDGESTLEQLILRDERAVCMARYYVHKQRDRLWEVPGKGEHIQLVELGTHCRGAIFLDGGGVKTGSLEEAFDQIGRSFEGFYFGRFDVRTPALEEFKQGRNFKVIELNGVTSEATHIYDPKNSLLMAYKTLFSQWRIAFEIGARNLKRGVKPTPIRTLAGLIVEYRRHARSHPAEPAGQRILDKADHL
ncbi:MAG: alpha/beta fold hydrolase [Acidobacteria bacterium]|nr:alpha/beta fold hydrolase [Acidobacteriota bacterium]